MKNIIKKSALSTSLIALVFVLCGTQLHAQDDAALINVTTLDQLSAIRYDLDGDGVVVFTTENPLATSTGNVDALAELSRYASQFTGGTYHTRAVDDSETPIANASVEAVVASTTYVYKLSETYEGYELMNNLNFNDSNNDRIANDPSKWAEDCMSSCVTGTQVNGTAGKIGWEPIGTGTDPFTSTFDGNNHTISKLYINRQVTGDIYAGLFGFIKGTSSVAPATLESLNLRNVNVKADSRSALASVGGLVGSVNSNSNIMLCSVTGDVFVSSRRGSAYGGGFVGQNYGSITSCYATGDVTITSTSDDGSYGGGLVGWNQGSITSCYAIGDVTSTTSGSSIIGGLVGLSNISITSCYATGDVTSTSTSGNAYGGGLLGWNQNSGSITASYATGGISSSTTAGTLYGGSLVGQNDATTTTTNSYYNDGVTITGGDIYQTWGDVWDFGTNIQYPALKVDFDGDGDATVTEFGPQRSAKFKSLTYYFYVNPDAVVTAVVGTVRASVVRDVYGLGYSILSQKIGEDAATTSGFAFAITDKDEEGTKVGELTVATALIPARVYTLSIQVDDDNGGMDLTEVFIEVGPEPPTAPTNLTATAVSATQIDLTWEASSDGGSAITGYDLEYSTDGNVPWMNLATSSTMTSFDDTGLTRGTTRHYRVAAINNVGTSAYSKETSATTHDVPDAPTLTATAVSETQVNLTWDAPSDGGSSITGYLLEYSANGNDPWKALATSSTMTTFSDNTELTRGTTRHYRVAAINIVGTGAYSEEASATTHDVPNAPKNLAATPGDAQVTLNWEVPANGGDAITHYAIKIEDIRDDLESFVAVQVAVEDLTDDGTIEGANVSYIVTMTGVNSGPDLVNGTTYFFQIAAVNSIGTGNYSTTIDATTTVPDAPTNLRATVVSEMEINLSWDAPSEDGGSAITGYDLEFSADGNGSWTDLTTSVTTTSFSDNTGLTVGSTRHYRVAAINNVGTGEYSTTTDAMLMVPGVPTNLTATAVSETQINLSWDAPSEDGGSAITGYDLEFSANGNEPWIDLTTSGTTTSFDDTGLTAGNTRHYRVAAINAVGTGTYSEEASATVGSPVLLSVPLEVEDGPGVYPNPGSDKVYVNLPNGNGAYMVRLHTLAGKVVLQKQLQGGTRTLSLSKLQDGVYILNLQKDGQSSSHRLIKATH